MFFVSPFLEYFCVYKVFASFKGVSIVHRWDFGDKAIGDFWDIHKFKVILLGPVKLLVSGFLGLVISGLSNLQNGDFFGLSRVLTPSLL